MMRICFVLAALMASACFVHADGYTLKADSSGVIAREPRTLLNVTSGPYTNLHFVWLAGQSNAQGATRTTNELGSLSLPQTSSFLSWKYLDFTEPTSEAVYTEALSMRPLYENFWGPEVTLAEEFYNLSTAGVAVIKTAMGSATLYENWGKGATDGRNLYNRAIEGFGMGRHALHAKLIDPLSYTFVWIQGYGDAANATRANAYETNLTNLINDIRTDTGLGTNLAVVIGRCSLSMTNTRPVAPLTTVRNAQTNAENIVSNCRWIDLDDATMWTSGGDAYVHYSDLGQMYMGRLLATNLNEVLNP